MAISKSRLLASILRITSNPRAPRDAATSCASFLGLKRARSEFLYWELPMTSATRRSAHAALAESTTRTAPHRAATHDETGLFILDSGCSASRLFILSQMLTRGRSLMTNELAGYGSASSRRYRNPNRLGKDRRLMCDVIFVAEKKLERMLSERERNLRLGLSCTKMQVIEIVWNGLIQRGQRRVHHQMVVTGVGL